MQPAKRIGLEQELHTLVDRLCAAPPAGRAQVFAELVQVACRVMQLEQEGGLRLVVPEPATPAAEPAAEPVPLVIEPVPPDPGPVLEGPFVRLPQGGQLLHAEGEHVLTHAEVTALQLQHGDIIRAVPTVEGGHRYERVCVGPLFHPDAIEAMGPVMKVEGDLATIRVLNSGDTVLVPTRDIHSKDGDPYAVLRVAYLRSDRWGGRFAGRVSKVYATDQQHPAQAPRGQRRKRQAGPEGEAECRPARLPQFALIEGRRPVIAVVGGQVKQRSRFQAILREYGASYRELPYSPSDGQIETAFKACDLVIFMPGCCRHGHLDSVKKHARNLRGVWLPAPSYNESGFRNYVERELIPQWPRLLGEMGRE